MRKTNQGGKTNCSQHYLALIGVVQHKEFACMRKGEDWSDDVCEGEQLDLSCFKQKYPIKTALAIFHTITRLIKLKE